MGVIRSITILGLALMNGLLVFGQDSLNLSIKNLPDLPPAPGQSKSIGFAGMLGGVNDGVLIASGGANFPEMLPWEGGQKNWSQAIYYLKDNQWQLSNTTLPFPLAYGASVSLPDGILCIGGNNAERTSKDVFMLDYDPVTSNIDIVDYPDLPQPLSNMAAVLDGDYVYVIGGINEGKSTNSFYRLNLKTKTAWERLPNFPGPPRALHTAVVQEASEAKIATIYPII